MGLPSRFHWYRKVAVGDQGATFAVNLTPTFDVPLIVGFVVVVNAFSTTAVSADVATRSNEPAATLVTRTLRCLPASVVATVYEAAVAPVIAAPLRSHWYESVVPIGR